MDRRTLSTRSPFSRPRSRNPSKHHLPDDISGAQVFWSLDDNYQNNCVIVLDQFEELLRDSPLLTEGIFEILGQLNHRTELKIVISFRSEYLQKLKPLESQVKPFTTSHFPLSEMRPEFALEVVTAPNVPERAPWVEESCAQQIVTLWQDALKADTQESKGMRGRQGWAAAPTGHAVRVVVQV